jgi:hypothetical protein
MSEIALPPETQNKIYEAKPVDEYYRALLIDT